MKQTKSTALYQTPFSKAYWRDAAMELKDIRILVFAALMIALRVALKSLGIPIAADLKINIAFFIKERKEKRAQKKRDAEVQKESSKEQE